jgi:GNAT superfamily N-acetyltransferase
VPHDAARLTEIAMAAKAHWGYPTAWMEIWRPQLTITAEYVQAHQVFAAHEGPAIHGVCALEDDGRRWTIEHVWVDPSRHGGGIGRALVRHALACAHAARPGLARVTADPGAASFYTRLGAVRIDGVAAPMPGAPERELPLFEIPTASASP